MPSKSAKQHRFMEAIAHSPSFARKAGVPQSVGRDFASADVGRKFADGGAVPPSMDDAPFPVSAPPPAPGATPMPYGDQMRHLWEFTKGAGRGGVAGVLGLPHGAVTGALDMADWATRPDEMERGAPGMASDWIKRNIPLSSDDIRKYAQYLRNPAPSQSLQHAGDVGEDMGQFVGDMGVGAGAITSKARSAGAKIPALLRKFGEHPTAGTLAEMPRYGAGGDAVKAIEWMKKFYGLRRDVPLQPITGTAAASVLRGGETQKAADFARQLQNAAQQTGARPGALRAVREEAINRLTGGNPNATLTKSQLAGALQNPPGLVRVINRQDVLPEKWQRKFGFANDEEEGPSDEAVHDRAHEILQDWWDNADHSEHYDHQEVMHDVFDDLDKYLQGNDVSSWKAAHAHEMLNDILMQKGLPPTGSLREQQEMSGVQRRLPLIGGSGSANERDLTKRERTTLADFYRAGLSGDTDTAHNIATHHLGIDTDDPNYHAFVSDLADAGNFPQFGSLARLDEKEHFDPGFNNLFSEHVNNHLDSARDVFHERHFDDAYEEARNDLGGDREPQEAEPWAYSNTQRLFDPTDPRYYTEQNVFSNAPTGLRLAMQHGDFAYRPTIPMANLQKLIDKGGAPDASYDAQHWARLASRLQQMSPDERRLTSHYPGFTPADVREKYLGHFRGSLMPGGDSSAALGTNPFFLEEAQSDPAQTFSRLGSAKEAPASLQDWTGQIGAAALHHAAQSGASAFAVPAAKAIESLRGSKDYGWLYDQALPQDVLEPFAKHYNVPITEGRTYGTSSGNAIPYRSVSMTPDIQNDILQNGMPYAVGGPVRMMMSGRTAATAATSSDPVVAHLMRHAPKIGKNPYATPLRMAAGGEVDWDAKVKEDFAPFLKGISDA